MQKIDAKYEPLSARLGGLTEAMHMDVWPNRESSLEESEGGPSSERPAVEPAKQGAPATMSAASLPAFCQPGNSFDA